MLPIRVHLDDGLLDELRCRLRFDASKVPIYLAPGLKGPDGFAFGEVVVLGSGAMDSGGTVRTCVLAHELCHVAQHVEGRVGAGALICHDDALEQEALSWERAMDRGPAPAARATGPLPKAARGAPRVQCRLSVGGTLVNSIDALSESVSHVLTLIEGGVDWAQWAITTEDNENFTFPTAESFVNGVQLGVHGTPNTLLPRSGVLVSPSKLLEIGGPQLSNLVSFEGSDEDNGVAKESLLGILQHTGIVALEAISSGLEFLSQLDIVDAPIFQVLDLADRLALHALVAHPPVQAALDKGLQKLASAYALDRARSVPAFADFYNTFLMFADHSGVSGGTKAASKKLAPGAQAFLDPLVTQVRAKLACPKLTGRPTPVNVYALMNDWLDGKKSIGLDRVSSGVRQVTQFAHATGSDLSAGPESFLSDYLEKAGEFVRVTEPSGAALSQDGSTLTFKLGSKAGSAKLVLDGQGCVALQSFTPATAKSTAPKAAVQPEEPEE